MRTQTHRHTHVRTRLEYLLPPETLVSHAASVVGNRVGLHDDLVGVLHGRLGPHADRPARTGCLDNGVVGLGGSLAVQVKDLADGVGSL